jgi:hypothetical protein
MAELAWDILCHDLVASEAPLGSPLRPFASGIWVGVVRRAFLGGRLRHPGAGFRRECQRHPAKISICVI